MMDTIQTHSRDETRDFGKRFGKTLSPKTLVTLAGDLGAGKTTLVQGILEGLGALPPYPSPTFVLMNQYELPRPTETGVQRIYHADAYRVGRDDFERLGFLEWCADPAGVVLVEWPERLSDLIPAQHVAIQLKALSDMERTIDIIETGISS